MRRRKLVIALIPVVIILLAACSGPTVGSAKTPAAGDSKQPVKLGVLGPITGPSSTYGIAEENGIKMAIDEVNAKGGLLGHKVTDDVRDDKADPSVATTQALDLVQSENVSALFGPIINTNALAVAQISNQLKVPVVGTLGATTPVVYPNGPTKAPYPWVYRVLVSSPVQVQALVKYGIAQGYKRWAMIYENDAYGQPTIDDLKTALKGTGGSLVSQQAIAVDATDATAQALAVQAAKPDVVLIWTVQAAASKIVSALSKVGSTTPVFSSNAQISPQFYQLAGPLANGIVSTGLKAQFDSGKGTTAFTTKYTSEFDIPPTLWAFASYDAANIYFATVKKIGTADPEAVRKALNSTNYTGITGNIKFTAQDHDGITSADISVVKIQDGAAALIK
jgi:branched-chain amino acid transport system substrate-binding protein